MADEPEDVEEAALPPPAPQPTARHARAYSLFLEHFRERSLLAGDKAEKVFILVLCSLKQRLVQEAAADDLRAPLPVRIHEALQACNPRHEQASRTTDLDDLYQRVSQELEGDRSLAESAIRLVLATLRAQLSESEAEQVGEALSLELRALWARPI